LKYGEASAMMRHLQGRVEFSTGGDLHLFKLK